jgi:FKBP-type peptidyl-prolyl cis-trans isomerase SlyD
MAINSDRVVELHYRLKDDQGQEIDASETNEPLSYVHGHGEILPGLERQLEGKCAGEQATIVVAPEEGFGEHHAELVAEVPRAQFDFEVEVGSVVQAVLPDGRTRYLQIAEVSEETVTVDANHPLAGKTLTFEVTVNSVREATRDELDKATENDLPAS